MFLKQITVFFILLCILGYIFGDYVLYQQAHYMLNQQYTIPAYEAFERIVKHYPKSRYAKEAREQMEKLRASSRDLSQKLAKDEAEYRKIQEKRQKTESFR